MQLSSIFCLYSICVNLYIIIMVCTSIYGGFSMTIFKPLIVFKLLGERILHVHNKENNFLYFSALMMIKNNKSKMLFSGLFFVLVFLLN